MKEMVYKPNFDIEVLVKESFDGYDYLIVSYGTHPCAYVKIPKSHPLYGKNYTEMDIACHGGPTFSGNLEIDSTDPDNFYVGWDYAHAGDYSGYNENGQQDKKYTVADILEDVDYVIYQLKMLEKRLTPEEALEKIDHTICLNYNEHTIKFGLDKYKDGPRGDSCDCESFEEFCNCFNIIEEALLNSK